MTQFSKKGGGHFFPRLLKCAVLEQPTLDSFGVSRGRSVAMAFGCWLLALQQQFNITSMALPWHFHSTSAALPKYTKIKMYRCFYPYWLRDSVSPICVLLGTEEAWTSKPKLIVS